MRTQFIQLAGILVAVFCLSGCGKNPTNSSSGNSAASYPLPNPPVVVNRAGVRGGKFIISELGEPKTFNFLVSDESASRYIGRLMFWGLLNFDVPSQTVKPGLADFWTNSPDGKTWTFHLRKNLFWSDGQPLTADDVVFTLNDVVYNPGIPNPLRDQLTINGKKFTVTKVDDQTIQVVTPQVYAPFLQAFGYDIPIYPKHTLAKYANSGFPSAYGVNWNPQDIVCDGPYCLKEYKQAQYTLLERNPYFIEVDTNGTRLPYFDEIIFATVPDMNALSLRFLSGESDVDDYIFPSEYDEFKAKEDAGKFSVLAPGVGLETTFFWFNQNTNINSHTGKPYVDPVKLKWFCNVKFRQAVSYALNRDAISASIFSGRAVDQYGFLTEGYGNWNNPNIKTYPYDPTKAVELLKEIGIEKRNGDDFLTDTDGNKIEFVFNTNVENPYRKKMAVLIAADLQKLGINVIFQPVQFNEIITKIDDTFDYDCVLLGNYSDTGTDPFGSMDILKSSGYDHYWFARETSPVTPWEARVDQLMDDQLQTLDMTERKKDFDEVQEILADQQPLIFTVTPMYYAAVKTNVGNVRATPLSYYRVTWNAEELYLKN